MSLPKGQQPEHECYIDIFYKFPLFWIFEPIQQKAKNASILARNHPVSMMMTKNSCSS
jgi:hypothetical protein